MTSPSSARTGRRASVPRWFRHTAGAGLAFMALGYSFGTVATLIEGDILSGTLLAAWTAALFAGAHSLTGGRG